MKSRIYYVCRDESAADEALVSAASPARALLHIAGRAYSVRRAEPEDIIRLTKLGIEIENSDGPHVTATAGPA